MDTIFYPIVIPLLAGLAVLVLPAALRGVREALALAGAGLAAWFAGSMFFEGGMRETSWEWFTVGEFSFSVDLAADALSRFVLFAVTVFAFLVIVYSIGFMRGRTRLRGYYVCVLWTAAAASLAVVADSLLVLLAGWEAVTALLFYLLTMGGEGSREAAGKTFVINGFSDCAMLLGVVFCWNAFGTLRMSEIQAVPLYGYFTIIYLLLLVGALVKAGAMPGHSWIPNAAESAPASVMAFLPASLDKLLGIYLLARISLFMFTLSGSIRMLLMIIGAVTIVAAVMMALIQHNLKKLLAFHAVSQVGYMVLGIGTGVPAGIAGGLFHMLNNAIYKCCLFLGAGAVEKRAGTTEFDNLGGLAKAMPVTFGAMLVAALAISGVPPLNGFASKWLVYQGTVEAGQPVFLLAALFGSTLTLVSFLKIIHSVFLGKRPAKLDDVRPAGFAMGLPMVILALFCVGFGVFARYPLTGIIGPALGIEFGGAGGTIFTGTAVWSPTLATGLILFALVIGALIYYFGSVVKTRATTPFMGGEMFESEEVRMPGTGFYETIRNLSPIDVLYRDGERGAYDVYILGGRYGMKFIGVLRAMHNGVVSTYIAFALIGLGGLLFYLLT